MKHPWYMTATVYGVLGLVFGLGMFMLVTGVRDIQRATTSDRWPTAPGAIVSSTAESSRSSDGTSTLSAKIVVKYQVAGREFTTETIRLGELFGSSDTSVSELQKLRYPAGDVIPVRYHPSNPEIATIEPGFGSGALWAPGAGLALILVSLMFASLYRNSQGSGGMAFGVSLFAAIFMMIGAPMLVFGGINLYRSYVSQRWPTTKGEVVYDEVDVSTTTTRDRGRTRTSTTYGARLIFKYDVGGKLRYSNTRRFGELAGADEEWANSIADRYPAGAKFDVYYDPSDPNLAILEPGIASEAFWIPGAGAAFFLFGLAAAWIIVPAMRKFP